MYVIDASAAAKDLDLLIERALAGHEIVVQGDGGSLVRLVPLEIPLPRRQRGSLAGQVIVHDAFFDPLPEEELSAWEPDARR